MRRKMGWTACGIVGFVFAPVGLLFTALALTLTRVKAAAWRRPEDSLVFLAVFGGVGGLFLILGLILLGADLRRRRLLRRAYDGGNRVVDAAHGLSGPAGGSCRVALIRRVSDRGGWPGGFPCRAGGKALGPLAGSGLRSSFGNGGGEA